MTRQLPIRAIDREAFRPFGEVISLDTARRSFEINGGLAVRHFDIATVDVADEVERAFVSVFAARPHPDSFEIELLERHPLGSQAFFPIGRAEWVVIVAPDVPGGKPGNPVAFRPGAGQGVNFGRGVWHYPLISLTAANFLVVDGGIGDRNLEIHRFEAPRWHVAALR